MAQIVVWESWRGACVHKLLSLFLPPSLYTPFSCCQGRLLRGEKKCVGNGSAYVSNARFGWCEHAFMCRRRRAGQASGRRLPSSRHYLGERSESFSEFPCETFSILPRTNGQVNPFLIRFFCLFFLDRLREVTGERGHLGKLDE